MSHSSKLIATNIEEYLKSHENKKLLRFITCGSVDDGKSTLIGRLLHDSKMIFEDQLSSIQKDSKKHGTTGEEIDLALLVDGLASEREQGITIDVAYRYFSTDKKKYIIADTPGHEQYTRNMATGASTADLAIILIDARYGVQTQTRRHSFIVNLLGIKNIVVAVNKMDLVEFSQGVFDGICSDFIEFTERLDFESIEFIPLSALKGDNVVDKSSQTPWFKGLPLMEFLDSFELNEEIKKQPLRFPVPYVNRPNLNFRGFCGSLESGSVSLGEEIVVLPSKKSTKVSSIITYEGELQSASAPMAVTITTEDEIDISRGDMIVAKDTVPATSAEVEADVVWMSESPLKVGSEYIIKRATTTIRGRVKSIKYKRDVNTLEELQSDRLELNEIGRVEFSLSSKIAYDRYEEIKGTGSFILIDRYTNNTNGAGMLVGHGDEKSSPKKAYTEAEIALNAYIREHYPEWGCLSID
ncbi:MAG: sulfate adenylyltransferase subunit CysN [Campylobacterales bacterium]